MNLDKQFLDLKRKQAFELLEQGYTQRQISKLIGISEVTLSHWKKKYKPLKPLLNETAFLLVSRINKKLQDPKLTKADLLEYAKALKELNDNFTKPKSKML